MRFYLGALVLASLLPVLGAAGFAMWQVGHAYREASTRQLQDTARALAQAVESELATSAAILETLATLPTQRGQNPEATLGQLRQVGAHLQGRVVVQPIPREAQATQPVSPAGVPFDLVESVARSGKKAVSNVFALPEDGEMRVALAVPYPGSGSQAQVLALVVTPQNLVRALQGKSGVPANGLIAVTDGTGRIIARSREPERFIGTLVPDWAALQAVGGDRGVFEARTFEGRAVILGFHKLDNTPGWVVVIGEPLASFNARWQQPLRTLGVGGLLAAVVALALAAWLARLVLRPVRALADNARRVAADDTHVAALVPHSPVAEFDALRISLADAETVLRTRAEAERRIAVALAVSESRYRHLTEALSKEKERLELATGAGGIGIIELDCTDHHFHWDQQTHVIFGRSAGDFDGSLAHMLSFLHPDDVPIVRQQWQTAMAESSVLDVEMRVLQPSGVLRHVQSHAQVVRQADGSPVRAIGTVWDVTAEREAAADLKAAKEAAEAAERLKSEFLAFMSHEIRTPMNTVMGMTRLVLQTDLSVKQRSYLGKIDTSSKLLLSIVNDLLDLSKIEAGKMDLEQAEFSLESLLETVSTAIGMRAEEKAIEIAYAVQPGVPARLVGDSLRLGQVLINLVGNALKFTEHGEVVITVAVESLAQGRLQSLRFSVRDTGIGLDADQIDRLFKPFSQADIHTSRHYGGTGLGLSICRKLVEMMGGRIWVTSKPGHGSIFNFIVKLRQAAEHPAPGAPQRALHGNRVLVVDDNASARDILAMMVRGFGMAVDTASSGQQAIGQLHEASAQGRSFDLVLMDWRMPGMDGLEAARRIRADTGLRHTPSVLMVTAFAREEILRQVETMHLAGVLIKPVTESLMFNTIADALGHGSGAMSAGDDPLPDLARLRERRVLLVEDNLLGQEVATEFLQQVGVLVEVARSGEEAIEKIREGDFELVLMDSHMPGMGGLAAARVLREDPRFRWLPIIAMTGDAQDEARRASLDAGINAHLVKPVAPEQLYQTLLAWLPKDPAFGALAGRRVLVVDDNAFNREVATEFLQAVRVEVLVAGDGAEALAQLRAHEVDAVLMDLQMPNMDGLTATREIRKQARWASLPIIALTAQDQLASRQATADHGMDAHLAKPIDESMLYRTLLQFLRPRHAGPPRASAASPDACAAAPTARTPRADAGLPDQLPGLDLPMALARLGGNPERLHRLLRGFLRDFEATPAQLARDLQAGQLRAIEAAGHTIKSAARYLGAEPLADAADAVEAAASHGDAQWLARAMPVFQAALDTVLEGLQGFLAASSTAAAPAGEAAPPWPDGAALLRRIAEVRPLVAEGNYAAGALLAGIGKATAGAPWAALAEAALTQFEDLELVDAIASLDALAAQAAQFASGDAPYERE